MPNFEWDEEKNRKNVRKHKLEFKEVESVFDDDDALEFRTDRDGELRLVRIGKTATKFIVFVVYTMRSLVVRFISARQASNKERNLYIEKKLKQQDDGDANG